MVTGVWLYAQAPGPRGAPTYEAFVGPRHGKFLAELAGTTEEQLRELIAMRNLLGEYPGPRASGGKGDAFPKDAGRTAALRASGFWRVGDKVVFVGRAVASAFGCGKRAWFKWTWVTTERGVGVWTAAFPHPSCVSHFWNEPTNVAAARNFMRLLLVDARRRACK